MNVASSSMTAVGLTNIQEQPQAGDFFTVTPTMIISVGAVQAGNDTYVVIVMGAGNNGTEVLTTVNNIFNNLKTQNPV
jgi:hypothetical protein